MEPPPVTYSADVILLQCVCVGVASMVFILYIIVADNRENVINKTDDDFTVDVTVFDD